MAIDWPPDEWYDIYNKYHKWAAWYSGSADRLLDYYSNLAQPFWAKEVKEDRQTMIHVPVAGDIASVSADLLLSEAPEIKIPEAHEESASTDAENTQNRINEIIDSTDLYSRLLEAAETASALSGVFVKVNWDTDFKPYPILSVAQPDNAIPEFKWGFLQKVTFHKVIDAPNMNEYWRHVEIHEPGIIRNQLWKGTRFNLGIELPLNTRSDTAEMEPVVNTGLDTLACRYIPNKKPNRLWRGSNLGQSDLSGIEGIMDSIDETYTSWVRDLRLARARLIVPEWMLELDDGKFKFNIDKEIFIALNQGPASAEESGNITDVQFDIRAEKHKNTALELLQQAYTKAGYSPSSFGMKDNSSGPTTAKEIRSKESKSFKTRNKKARYMQKALEEILQVMLMIDKIHFNNNVNPDYRPQVNLQDSIQTDPLEKADSLNKINQAQAMSIDTKVRTLHPDWEEEQIKAEVKRIMEEQGMSVENPEVRV